MVSKSPLVSIVILNWNGLENTKLCLEHVRKIAYPNYEIVVVDNGSNQKDKKYLAQEKGIIYIDNPVNRGFTGGHIDGLRRCQGEFIVLLNNDAIIKQDYLEKALPMFDDPTVAAAGGRAYFWNDSCPILNESNPFYSYQEVDIHTGEARSLQFDFGTVQEVNNVSGSAVVVRKAVIDKVGYLHEPFFAYFEETDLFARMKRAGYKVLYNPQMQIWHRNGGSSGASAGSYFFYYHIFRNRFTFAARNFETAFFRQFLLIYFHIGLKSLVKLILRPNSDKDMNRAYARAAGVNFFKLPLLLLNRGALTRQLGKSRYNHQIYQEQTGISIVLDCTALSDKKSKIYRRN